MILHFAQKVLFFLTTDFIVSITSWRIDVIHNSLNSLNSSRSITNESNETRPVQTRRVKSSSKEVVFGWLISTKEKTPSQSIRWKTQIFKFSFGDDSFVACRYFCDEPAISYPDRDTVVYPGHSITLEVWAVLYYKNTTTRHREPESSYIRSNNVRTRLKYVRETVALPMGGSNQMPALIYTSMIIWIQIRAVNIREGLLGVFARALITRNEPLNYVPH